MLRTVGRARIVRAAALRRPGADLAAEQQIPDPAQIAVHGNVLAPLPRRAVLLRRRPGCRPCEFCILFLYKGCRRRVPFGIRAALVVIFGLNVRFDDDPPAFGNFFHDGVVVLVKDGFVRFGVGLLPLVRRAVHKPHRLRILALAPDDIGVIGYADGLAFDLFRGEHDGLAAVFIFIFRHGAFEVDALADGVLRIDDRTVFELRLFQHIAVDVDPAGIRAEGIRHAFGLRLAVTDMNALRAEVVIGLFAAVFRIVPLRSLFGIELGIFGGDVRFRENGSIVGQRRRFAAVCVVDIFPFVRMGDNFNGVFDVILRFDRRDSVFALARRPFDEAAVDGSASDDAAQRRALFAETVLAEVSFEHGMHDIRVVGRFGRYARLVDRKIVRSDRLGAENRSACGVCVIEMLISADKFAVRFSVRALIAHIEVRIQFVAEDLRDGEVLNVVRQRIERAHFQVAQDFVALDGFRVKHVAQAQGVDGGPEVADGGIGNGFEQLRGIFRDLDDLPQRQGIHHVRVRHIGDAPILHCFEDGRGIFVDGDDLRKAERFDARRVGKVVQRPILDGEEDPRRVFVDGDHVADGHVLNEVGVARQVLDLADGVGLARERIGEHGDPAVLVHGVVHALGAVAERKNDGGGVDARVENGFEGHGIDDRVRFGDERAQRARLLALVHDDLPVHDLIVAAFLVRAFRAVAECDHERLALCVHGEHRAELRGHDHVVHEVEGEPAEGRRRERRLVNENAVCAHLLDDAVHHCVHDGRVFGEGGEADVLRLGQGIDVVADVRNDVDDRFVEVFLGEKSLVEFEEVEQIARRGDGKEVSAAQQSAHDGEHTEEKCQKQRKNAPEVALGRVSRAGKDLALLHELFFQRELLCLRRLLRPFFLRPRLLGGASGSRIRFVLFHSVTCLVLGLAIFTILRREILPRRSARTLPAPPRGRYLPRRRASLRAPI